MSDNTKPASELSNGQAVNGTAPIPSVIPTEIRQPHDLGVSGHGCPLPDCGEVIHGLGALSAHILTHGASPAVADPPKAEPMPSPKQGRLPDGSWFELDDDGKRVTKSVDPKLWAKWAAGADGYRLANEWAYDEEKGGYHRWDGQRWAHKSRKGEMLLWEDAIGRLPDASPLRSMLMDKDRHARPTLEVAITRDLRFPPDHLVPVANGMFDLLDGALRAFDANTDTHREIIPTGYQADWDDAACVGAVRGWFNPSGTSQLTEPNFQTFLDAVGLMLSGRAQKHRPLTFLWGKSDSGKGGTQRLLTKMLGKMAQAVAPTTMLFNKGSVSTHNAPLANLILNQQLLAIGSEIRGRSNDQLLQSTGDEMQSARFPNQQGGMIEGYVRNMYILSTTTPPALPMERGILRRLLVIRYDKAAVIADADRREPTDTELAALLTIGLRRAMLVHQPGYQPPTTDPEVLGEFLTVADPFREYIRELADANELHGMSTAQIEREYQPTDRNQPTLKRISEIITSATTGLAGEWGIIQGRLSPNANNGGSRTRYYFAYRKDAEPTTEQVQQWAVNAHDRTRGAATHTAAQGLVS